MLVGMAGMVVIVAGSGKLGTNLDVTLMGLRQRHYLCRCRSVLAANAQRVAAMVDRAESPLAVRSAWSTYILLCFGFDFWMDWLTKPAWRQLVLLFVFGSVQMGLTYWLFARGLRSVSAHEAGAITLLEPLLNPLWAYLISPETDTPPQTTWVGGALIIGALAYRYLPRSIYHRDTGSTEKRIRQDQQD